MNNLAGSPIRPPRRGLSLLEMILATAILMAGAIAMAQISFVTTRHATRGQDEMIALEIASYHFEMMALGLIPTESVSQQPVVAEAGLETLVSSSESSQSTHPSDWEDWVYSLSLAPSQKSGIYKVQLDLYRLPPGSVDSNSGAGNGGEMTRSPSVDPPPQPNATTSADTVSAGSGFLFRRSYVRLLRRPSGTASTSDLTGFAEGGEASEEDWP